MRFRREDILIFIYTIATVFLYIFQPTLLHATLDKHVTYVLITVDAEGPPPGAEPISPYYGKSLLTEQVNAIDNGGVGCGLTAMMDIADRFDAPVTFFLDVTEEKLFGKERMKAIAQYILKRNHDVQLHVDSLFLLDPDRPYLNQYSLEEQTEIIIREADLLEQWTGRRPVGHRAGAYAANADTLSALVTANIPLDSSYFHGKEISELQHIYGSRNALSENHGILQVPVTVFEMHEYAQIFGFRLPATVRQKKIDIDSCTEEDLVEALGQAADQDLDVAILFMHSFSFIRNWGAIEQERRADLEDIREFENVLRFIQSRDDLRVASVRNFYQNYRDEKIVVSGHDVVPRLYRQNSMINYGRRILGIDRQNVLYWIFALSFSAGGLGFLCYRIFKRRRWR